MTEEQRPGPDLRGDFTRAIDSEKLLRASGASEVQRELERQRQEQERAAREARQRDEALRTQLAQETSRIVEVLASRAQSIQRQFPNARVESDPAAGRVRYRFEKSAAHSDPGLVELVCQVNAATQAIIVDSRVEITGRMEPRQDYITFNLTKIEDSLPKVKKFLEGKLRDFVRSYLNP